MTVSNDFLVFAQGGGANVETQSSYAVDPLLPIGNQPGVAISAFNNKALRQANAVTSQLAQYIANTTQVATTDDATPTKLLSQITSALMNIPPSAVTYGSGSGNWNSIYYFFISSGNATTSATYTNNGITYTVLSTISAGTVLITSGTGSPTNSGTLTKATGTGDSAITFYSFRAPTYLRVRMVGGGGGGSGSGTSGATGGGAGGTTTFGSAFLSANGGGGGGYNSAPGTGGTASSGSALGFATTGGSGSSCPYNTTLNAMQPNGGSGAASPFGGAGGGGTTIVVGSQNGVAAAANSGSGGGGGGANSAAATNGGTGGGAGGYVDVIVLNPAGTYAYSIGAAGTAGAAGTNGAIGGAGGTGFIEVTLHFQ